MATILDGKKISERWLTKLAKQQWPGALAAILVGNDPASVLYVGRKAEAAKRLGADFIIHRLPATSSEQRVISLIDRLNHDAAIAGIMVQLPMPNKLSADKVVNRIDPSKDVDGLTDTNVVTGGTLPATARGIIELLRAYKIKLTGQRVVLLGFTRLLNLPLSIWLMRRGNQVIVLQKGTRDHTQIKTADIVISAVGKPSLIKGADIKKDATVIDAGITKVGKRIVGDVDFATASRKAKWITPVPGGVGPMTVAALFANLADAKKPRS